jgi:NAD(P)-dependent dehydrogenase (short-subunit alcohol dehydrogenase family)
MNKSILITGANGGIGKDTARQLAMLEGTEKIYLAGRNEDKLRLAKQSLEETTGSFIFEIVIMDVSNPDSVRSAVETISEPIDALILNAGGMGGKSPQKITSDGTTQQFSTNVLGHVILVDELIKAGKINNAILYAGSEAARGVKKMGMDQPNLKTSSVDEFESIMDGSFFGQKMDPMQSYGYVKYTAALWMSSAARKNPNIRFITMSPGGTKGTAVMDDLSGFMKFIYKYIAMPFLMPLMGMAHSLETGAKRFVDGITNETLKSGVFYGSKANVLTGVIIEQSTLFPDLTNESFQDNANEAIHRFIS